MTDDNTVVAPTRLFYACTRHLRVCSVLHICRNFVTHSILAPRRFHLKQNGRRLHSEKAPRSNLRRGKRLRLLRHDLFASNRIRTFILFSVLLEQFGRNPIFLCTCDGSYKSYFLCKLSILLLTFTALCAIATNLPSGETLTSCTSPSMARYVTLGTRTREDNVATEKTDTELNELTYTKSVPAKEN